MKRVSVVIPAYNKAELTMRTVESVLKQTYRNVEIIVVDDGSTDSTRERLAMYGNTIRYMYKENGGACSARNMGIRAARGEYIGLIDCDDLYLPKKIEMSVAYLEKHPHIGFVRTPAYFIDANDRIISIYSHSQRSYVGWIYKKLLLFNFICNSTVIAKKACFGNVGLFDETVFSPADWDMWLRLSEKYKAGYLPVPLTKYRISHNYILNNLEKVEKEDRLILEKELQRHPDLGRLLKRRARSNLYLRFATAYLRKDSYDKAKGLFLASMYTNPFHVKAIIYFFYFLFARKNFQSRLQRRMSTSP